VSALQQNPADEFAQPDISTDDTDAASEALTAAALDVAETLTRKAAGTDSAAEAKDFTAAVLNLAQTLVILDPSLAQDGTPLEHAVIMKGMENDGRVAVEQVRGENAARQARETARMAAEAPTPTKKVKSRRGSDGSTEYEVTG
jgi:hypothetical protein